MPRVTLTGGVRADSALSFGWAARPVDPSANASKNLRSPLRQRSGGNFDPLSAAVSACRVESLEDRRHFSGGHYVHNGFDVNLISGPVINTFSGNGIVTLNGQNSTNNVETVTLSADGKTIIATQNGVTSQFPTWAVSKIKFYGGNGGNDLLSTDHAVTIGSSFQAGSANTTVLAGGGDDTIHGGSGNDSIVGGTGNDIAWSAGGNDTLVAGTGNDTLNGGPGKDSIRGGPGADELLSQSAATIIVPGSPLNWGDFTSTPVTPPTSSTLQPVITATTSTTITAGHAVHVQGLASGLVSGTALTNHYQWDFGDTTRGSQYDQLDGWNAAHLYDTPGTYTVTLTLTGSDGKSAQAQTTVTVQPNNLRTIYVAANGNDNNDGSNLSNPVQSVGRANELLGSNTQVLFRTGDTFPLEAALNLTGYQNVTVSTYGNGAQPVLLWDGVRGNNDVLVAVSGSSGITIRGLTFDSIFNQDTSETGLPMGIRTGGYGISVIGNTFLNVATAVDGSSRPTGLLVQGNSSPSPTGLRAYFAWVEGSDVVILGNSVVNSTREHIIRAGLGGVTRVLIAYNSLDNQDRESVDSHDIAKGTITLQSGSYAYVAHNKLWDGPTGVGPLGTPGFASNPLYQAMRFQWTVYDGNTLNAPILLQPGADHLMIRNNLSYRDDSAAFIVNGFDSAYNRQVEDATLANNTVVNNGTLGSFLTVTGPAKGLALLDNLYAAPNLMVGYSQAASVYVQQSDLSSFSTISHNVWPSAHPIKYAPQGQMYVWPYWENNGGLLSPSQWNAFPQVNGDQWVNVSLNSNSQPIGPGSVVKSGVAVPGVFQDFNGAARNDASVVVGAFVVN